jgi:hypothetical protein
MVDHLRQDTVLETIAFATVEEVLVLCHSKANPSEAEWDVWIPNERRGEHRALLVVTLGGAPNSRQRARVADVIRAKGGAAPPVAILTDSAINRTLMTAFTWLLGRRHEMKAFDLAGVDEAIGWAGVKARPDRVRSAIARLQGALAKPRVAP